MSTAAKPFKVHVIEDERTDAKIFIRALRSTGIFNLAYSSDLERDGYLNKAEDADVIALDARIRGVISPSLDAAERLISRNPAQSVVFVTRVPSEVHESPGNFIIEKYTAATESYVSTLFMIMVYDKTLSLLTWADALAKKPGDLEVDRFFYEVRNFYISLKKGSELLSEMEVPRQRYGRLLSLLGSALDHHSRGTDRTIILRSIRRPLLDTLAADSTKLRQISGVHATKSHDVKVAKLSKQLLKEKPGEGLLDLGLGEFLEPERSGELLWEAESHEGLLHQLAISIGAFLARMETRYMKKPVPQQTRHDKGEAEALKPAALYLNIWFPDHSEKRTWLIVGSAAALFVNIGPSREGGPMSQSAGLSAQAESMVYSTDYVDVIVLCPGADVIPLRNRLPVPPDPDKIARFEVTPRRAGLLQLTVELLVKNEPIHRTSYPVEAREAGKEESEETSYES